MKLLNQLCQSGVHVSIDKKSIFSLIRIFKSFIVIIHFLGLHKEQKKKKKPYFHYVFTFVCQIRFCGKPLLKTALRHPLCHVYIVKLLCGKI